MKQNNPNDKHNEQYWQEIFESIDMDVLPVEYMNRIIISFDDGTEWDIDIKDSRAKQLFLEYDDTITNIDFRMDMDRLKTELTKRVNRFIKLNK